MKHAVRRFVCSVLIFAASVASAQSAPEVQQTTVGIQQLQQKIDSLQRRNQGASGSLVSGWSPDLRKSEDCVTAAILVTFLKHAFIVGRRHYV